MEASIQLLARRSGQQSNAIPSALISFVLLALLWLVGCGPSGVVPPAESAPIALIGGVLLDGKGEAPVPDSIVVIEGGKIRAAGPRSLTPVPKGAERIDVSGKYVIPGLIDLHVHLGSRAGAQYVASAYTRERVEKNLQAYLYFGVTAVRSLGIDRDAIFPIRADARTAKILSPHLFTVGRGFTAPNGHPTQEVGAVARQVETPEEAVRQVQELASQQVDGIKMWVDTLNNTLPSIRLDVCRAIIEEAARHSIPVAAHIYSQADTRALVGFGIHDFVHMIRDVETVDPALVATLRERRTVFAPTLIRQELAWFYSEHPERLADPDVARTMDADVIDAARAAKPSPDPVARREFDLAMKNTLALARAGVPMAVGSDGGSALDFPGLMTHRELELLVQAGLTPLEAISAATRHGAACLQGGDDLGTLASGKWADLVVLSADPLADIRNTRRIERVMLAGRWIDRPALRVK
ncbi:MAG: amidohydrolase family protein [Acidobacteria bacterium]|nr:amidohydrolase family protein [Acidobacteriota bacterium]